MLLDTNLHSSLAANELLASAAVGAITFPSLLAFSQTAIFKPLRITAASRLSPVFGAVSVTLAGFAASFSAIKACSLVQNSLGDTNGRGETNSKNISFSTPELVISTVSSVVVFRALGGRFSSVLPSHLFHPGAFARERIPAIRGFQLANLSEKNLIRDYGRKYGCHTCGKKKVSSFVSDHQPPSHLLRNGNSSPNGGTSPSTANGKAMLNSEASSGNGGNENAVVRQFFYPQCFRCSSSQGGYLNSGKTAKAIVTHPFSLRLYHAFLPIPFSLAYLKSKLQEEISLPFLTKMSSQCSDAVKNITQSSDVARSKVDRATQTTGAAGSTVAVATSSGKNTLRSIIQESDISHLVSNFPLLIVWQKAVQFLDSFKNPGDGFHIMLWAFVIVAAWGTI